MVPFLTGFVAAPFLSALKKLGGVNDILTVRITVVDGLERAIFVIAIWIVLRFPSGERRPSTGVVFLAEQGVLFRGVTAGVAVVGLATTAERTQFARAFFSCLHVPRT